MFSFFSNKKQEKGQGLVEYAIVLALIAIVVIGVMTTLGKKTCNTLNKVGNSLDGGSSSGCSAAAVAVASSPAPAAITCGNWENVTTVAPNNAAACTAAAQAAGCPNANQYNVDSGVCYY